MDNKNQSIACSVNSCANHCTNENYCSLKNITVGKSEAAPKTCGCTECDSFKLDPAK